MASVSKTSSGARRVQFFDGENRRRSVHLGKVTDHAARSVATKIEALLAARLSGVPVDRETAEWVGSRDSVMYERLAEVGLVPKREAATLAAFLDAYAAQRSDVKPGTRITYGNVRRNLITYFGAQKPLRDITPGDSDEFRLNLTRCKTAGGEGLSDATARRRCKIAGQFFRAAVRKGLVAVNPFEGIGGSVRSNKARMFFVTRAAADQVLAACPDLEWRLIFALARFGGLRTPSEHYGLRWGDIDWAGNKFLVHSPKTERHEGSDSRWVPIFPELRPLLTEAFEKAPEGSEYVVDRYRNQANLRTRFNKIIKRSGLQPWPKLFHNLRSTRQTELAAEYPLHLVCAWLGNKAAVAAEHYLQITDEDYRRAAEAVCTPCAVTYERDETERNDGKGAGGKVPAVPQVFPSFPIVQNFQVGPEGFEPTTKGL